jgi:hypothetical protein
MNTVPQEVIDSVWEEVLATPPEQAEMKVQAALEAQPAICMYLLALDEELLPPEERGMLMMIGYCILCSLSEGGRSLPPVTPEALEDAEQANLALLEKLDDGPEMDFTETVSGLLRSYRQAPLLGTVLEALMEGYEDDPDNAPENTGMLFLHLKSVIDCLDR